MICPLPWIHLMIDNDSVIKVCCRAKQGKNALRKDTSERYTAYNNISIIRNCEQLKDIRKTFLNNNIPEACERCKLFENNGLVSPRQKEYEKWRHIISEKYIRENTREDGSIDEKLFPLYHWELRLGNLCNMACRTCGPKESSLWDNDRSMNWYMSNQFKNTISTYINEAKHIHFLGGEPLIIEDHWDFLKNITFDKRDEITLEYNTNLKTIPYEKLKIWRDFKQVHLNVSVDGIGKVNEFIRYPLSWGTFIKNLNYIDTSSNKNITITTTYTVNILNILDIQNYFEYFNSDKFYKINKYINIPKYHMLVYPQYLSLTSLPKFIKNHITNKFKNDDRLKPIIEFMYSKDTSDLFEMFIKKTNNLSRKRTQDPDKYVVELWELIKKWREDDLPNTMEPFSDKK